MPGMLSVADVTTKLMTWKHFREPQGAGAHGDPAAPLVGSGPTDPRTNFFQALQVLLASGLRFPANAGAFLHFERLVHATELLGSTFSLPPDPRTADEARFLLAPLLAPIPGRAGWNIDGSNFTAAAHEACYEILNWFKDRCDTVSTGKHPQARALKELARRSTLRLFSLNYDDIPHASGVDFYTGFEGRVFRPKYPWPRGRHILCQLHGSVLFGTGSEEEGFEVVCLPSREAALQSRQVRGSGPRFQDGHLNGDAPMITGLRKADKTLSRPFGTYMHVMRDELLRCRRWLVVGYGFADTHINEAMQQARAIWQQRRTDVRAVVVNFHAPPHDHTGAAVLSAWPGTAGGDALEAACGPVFNEDLATFRDGVRRQKKAPNIDESMFTPLSNQVAVHLGGTSVALGKDLSKVEAFIDGK